MPSQPVYARFSPRSFEPSNDSPQDLRPVHPEQRHHPRSSPAR